MTLGLNSKLQQGMLEGVILLNGQGQVMDFNPAALPWLHCAMGATQQLRHHIDMVVQGGASLPEIAECLHMTDPVLVSHKVYLCEAGTEGYALFIAEPEIRASVPAMAQADTDFFRLLCAESRHQLSQVCELLHGATGSAFPGHESAAVAQFDRLSRLLVAFDQLSRLHRPDAFTLGDRLSVASLLDDVLKEMPSPACEYQIRSPEGERTQLQSPVYGDAGWLKCMFNTLLGAIGESAPSHSKVEIRVRQSGRYSVVSSHYTHRTCAPGTGGGCGLGNANGVLHLDTDIGIQIASRIAEMHGGQLAITGLDPSPADEAVRGIESFTLLLPTSAPAQSGESPACKLCIAKLQTEKYATDLASLMPSRPDGSEMSEAELQMLAHISVS